MSKNHLAITSQTTAEAVQRIASFLQAGLLIYVLQSPIARAPEIIPGLSFATIRSYEGLITVRLRGYYRNPIILFEGAILHFLLDRLIVRGTSEHQFVTGHTLQEVEQEWLNHFPITRDQAQGLFDSIAPQLDPALTLSIETGPRSTEQMQQRFQQEKREFALRLSLASQPSFSVFPLVQLVQWQTLVQFAQPVRPEDLALPDTCTEQERAMIINYSQMLLALRR